MLQWENNIKVFLFLWAVYLSSSFCCINWRVEEGDFFLKKIMPIYLYTELFNVTQLLFSVSNMMHRKEEYLQLNLLGEMLS